MRGAYPFAIKAIGLLLLLSALVLAMTLSTILGATAIPWETAVASFVEYDETSNEHLIIRTTRVPRALVAAFVGASLAVAGALMQALTRNPLASPSVLGINAGAATFVVAGVTLFSVSTLSTLMWFAFAGAGLAALSVYFLGSMGRDGLTPVKIILAGAAMTALFSSITQSMLVLNEKGLDEVLFWLTGAVSGRTLEMLGAVLPYMVVGLVISWVISRQINLFTLGEDVARGLGQKVDLLKGLVGIIVVLLAGSSVAVAGPIGFIGIIIPHIAKFFVGNDYRWLLPYSALMGGILLNLADTAGRFIIMPEEIPVGVMTALIGTPFFIIIARRGLHSR